MFPEKDAVSSYSTIKQDLTHKIKTGYYKANEKIDSENVLCSKYGVSRPTVRRAIDALVYSGFLWRKQGKGTFVNSRLIHKDLNSYTPFAEDVAMEGKKFAIKIISMKTTKADEAMAMNLGMLLGDKVLRTKSLRFVDGTPRMLRVSYFPLSRIPRLPSFMCDERSMFDAVHMSLDSGLYVAKAKQTFQVIRGEKSVCSLLELAGDMPLIMWDGINYLNNGLPIEYTQAWHESTNFIFTIEQARNL